MAELLKYIKEEMTKKYYIKDLLNKRIAIRIYNDKSEKELNKKLLNFNNYFCIYQGSFLKERIEDNEEIYIILHESALEAIEYKYGEVWYTKKELNNVKNTNFIYEFIEVEDIIE